MSSKKGEDASKAMKRRATSGGDDLVPRNSKGGVLVTEEELKAAFDFFDNMPAKEYRFLMNNKSEMTLEDLKELLLENEVKNFDPVAEAFKVYDPDGTGFVDSNVLRSIFENLGFGEITDDDLTILTETGDVDGDGKISLMDFRKMLDFNKQNPEPEPSPSRARRRGRRGGGRGPEPGAAEAGAAFADGILARAEENSRGGAGAEREAESKWRALGAGAKLGDGSADDAAAPAAPAADDVGEPLDVRVTFFADGFTVEEDPNGAAAPLAEPAPRRAGIATLRDGAPAARRPRFEPPPCGPSTRPTR
ncbi:hypothetical protein JL722_6608 [Aureococcus anophagefferens]|nr:hypothetical protein JL722_6608 [Aureococcus anophagefferens]